MTAQEALALSTRKINSVIIEAIERAAKNKRKEVRIGFLWAGEEIIVVTDEDIEWLVDNGYGVFKKREAAPPFYDEQEEVLYVTWDYAQKQHKDELVTEPFNPNEWCSKRKLGKYS